jgi:phage pi2 protein 07
VKDLDGQLSELPRTRELTEMLIHGWVVRDLWEKFGIVSDVVVRELFFSI